MFDNKSDIDLSKANHRRQFVNFRVVVYRLHLPNTTEFKLKDGTPVPFDFIFNADFGDSIYSKISRDLNSDPKEFARFLEEYSQAIKSSLTLPSGNPNVAGTMSQLSSESSASGVTETAPFQEIDITPLVRSVNIHLSLTPVNQCSLTMFDPRLTNLTDVELDRFHMTSRERTETLAKLQAFRFREFDLVRVFAYSDVGLSPLDHQNAMKKKVFKNGLESRFYMPPVFTGLVNAITRINQTGTTAALNVDIFGVQRMFMQSVSVFNEALSNILAEASPDMSTMHDKFEIFDGRYADQAADTIALKLFGDYLLPLYLREKSTKEVLVGVPDLDNIIARMFRTDRKTRVKKALFYPMLPTVILLHMLKKKYGEPILTFDDRINPKIPVVNETGSAFEIVSESEDLGKALKPYLLRFRNSFSVYNASYQSAEEIFDTVRSTTFLEIFEDRTSGFHYRFPRYNSVAEMIAINPQDVVSVSHMRSDSAIYTADVANISIPAYGVAAAIDPKVFLDRLSILKFGLRMPQTSANPNAGTGGFAKALAKFSRDYYTYGQSRRATIVKLGDPSINIGQMVLFSMRRTQNANPADMTKEGAYDTFAGYIVEITEELSVGGNYIQTLQLAFVRQAARAGNDKIEFYRMKNATMAAFSVPGYDSRRFIGTVWDIANTGTSWVNAMDSGPQEGVTNDGTPAVTLKNLESVPGEKDSDTRAFLYTITLVGESQKYTQATMTRLADPRDLAREAMKDKGIVELATKALLAAGGGDSTSLADLEAAYPGLNDKADERRMYYAITAIRLAVLSEFQLLLPSQGGIIFGPNEFTFNKYDFVFAPTPVGSVVDKFENLGASRATYSFLNQYASKLESGLIQIVGKHSGSAQFHADIAAADRGIASNLKMLGAGDKMSSATAAGCVGFPELLKAINEYEKTDPFAHSGPSFLDRWHNTFSVVSEQSFDKSVLDEANDLISTLRLRVQGLISAVNSELGDRSDLAEIIADIDSNIAARKKIASKPSKAKPKAPASSIGPVPPKADSEEAQAAQQSRLAAYDPNTA